MSGAESGRAPLLCGGTTEHLRSELRLHVSCPFAALVNTLLMNTVPFSFSVAFYLLKD